MCVRGACVRRRAVGMARGRAGARTHTSTRRPIPARRTRTHTPRCPHPSRTFLEENYDILCTFRARVPPRTSSAPVHPPQCTATRTKRSEKIQKCSQPSRDPADFNEFSRFFFSIFPRLSYMFV